MISEAVCARVVNRVIDDEIGRRPGDEIKDIGDGAGVTSYGQTQGWLDQWGFTRPTTRAEAYGNFRAFMALSHIDELSGIDQAESLMLAVFTRAVNRTHPEAIRLLQKQVVVAQDGILGKDTAAAVAHGDVTRVLVGFIADTHVFYAGLVQDYPRLLGNIEGWIARYARILKHHFSIAT